MPRALIVIAVAALLPVAPAAGPPQDRPGFPGAAPAATALIVGQVIDAHAGRGVPGALVSLTGGSTGTAEAPASPDVAPILDRTATTQRVLATADGRFVFRDLAPGIYHITARKGGYLEGAYGRRIPGGATRSLVLADGERTADIDVPMWKHAAITGTITDEAGEPVVGIEVRATRRSFIGGRRRFAPAGTARTDDRGVYRLSRLAPGAYLIAVVSTQVAVPAAMLEELRRGMEARDPERTAAMRTLFEAGASTAGPGSALAVQVGNMIHTVGRSHVPPPPIDDGMRFVYPSVFYPSSESSNDANLVSIASGEERGGLDLQLKPVPATQISGRIVSAAGPVPGVVVRLEPAASEDFARELDAATTVSGSDGSFSIPAVPLGHYVLHAEKAPPPPVGNAPTTIIQSGTGMTIMTSSPSGRIEPQLPRGPLLWARMPIAIEGPLHDVEVSLQPGAGIRGRVVFDGAAAPPTGDELTRIAVFVEPSDGRARRVMPIRVDRFGRFTSMGLAAGRYVVRAAGAPASWTFSGAMLEGRDVSDVPLELSSDINTLAITFTDRPATLSGTVRTPQGAPDPDATVLVFPSDPRMWTDYGLTSRRFRMTRAGTTGGYTLTGLPAGSYAVAAVPDDLTADWQDPVRLEVFARRAVRVAIAERQSRAQDLTSDR